MFEFKDLKPIEGVKPRTSCIASYHCRVYGGFMRYFIVLLVLLAGLAQAEIYKSTSADGEVIFSDQPSPGAEQMQLPELPTYSAPPARTRARSDSAGQKQPAKSPYQSVVFTAPEDDATVRNNLGDLSASVSLQPALKTRLGHRIQYYLDDAPHGQPVSATAINFTNLDRGSHRLSASVVDSQGGTIISTDTVTFHLHRESLNFPNRQAPAN